MTIKLLLLLILPFQLSAQNLVRNPSFEIVRTCTDTISSFSTDVASWSTPNYGTTDLFNSCSTESKVSIPQNYIGNQVSKFGNKYAGFYLFSDEDYREYIQGEFLAPLEKGKKYRISFYISLGESSKYALKSIGFILSNPKILYPSWGVLSQNELENLWMDNSSIYKIGNKNFYSDFDNWTLVSKDFVAKGGENFLVIGNFDTNSNTKKKIINKKATHKISYYFIDMVSVEPLFKEKNIEIAKTVNKKEATENSIILNKRYVFENIEFKYNSVEFSSISKDELKNLVAYLKKYKELQIIISGHTDNIGTNQYNKELSMKRAEAVSKYIYERGIDRKRVKSIGYGNEKPLQSNEFESGRKANRRVEFILTQYNEKHSPD